jgi:hypothetical protein
MFAKQSLVAPLGTDRPREPAVCPTNLAVTPFVRAGLLVTAILMAMLQSSRPLSPIVGDADQQWAPEKSTPEYEASL